MAKKTMTTNSAAKKEVKVTKESKLVKLLSGKELYTLKEIIAKTGFAAASAKMYTSAEYLKRKNKPYKVVESKKGKDTAYRFKIKAGKK
ncbi:MAG: hypothetical protein NG740_07240 [Omnitrophica bacterium]|nr:hypothetical protein [Candidatus Omnitrophota bacterium]